jgi:hypothetical protein
MPTLHSTLEENVAEYERAMAADTNTWVAANGGTEPVSQIDGRHYQMLFNPCLMEKGYYCYETDLFDTALPACLTGNP